MIQSQVLLTPADGMPETCAINMDHLRSIGTQQVGKLIAVLSPEKMHSVRTALLFALGFDEPDEFDVD